jgi:DNA-binding response OmpR family regulator
MPADTTRKSVLLVDTDRDLLLGLGIRLRTSGYQIHIAMDPISAVTLARKEGPDLIVLRLGLLGSDALATQRRLQAVSPLGFIPLVLLADRTLTQKEEVLAENAVAVFLKPIDYDEVVATVAEALRESGNAISG